MSNSKLYVGNLSFKTTEDELRSRLTPEQYEVTQHGGTERAFTGVYNNANVVGASKVTGVSLTGGIDAYSSEVDPSLPRYRIEIED